MTADARRCRDSPACARHALFTHFWIVAVVLTVPPAHAEPLGQSSSLWRYGAFLDLSGAADFNFPENHRWRSKATTPRVNELAPNMGLAYVRKDTTPQSRWGMELAVQGGYDTDGLVPSSIPGRQRPVEGAEMLRHVGQANVSYLAPVGRGLTLTAGLFKSYIGYSSLYARENLNYTRPYIADNSPYLLFGLAARYPVSDRLKLGFFLTNGYSYLSYVNNQPHYGTQVSWKMAPRLTLTQNLYYGPDQMNTALQFWRFYSDSIVEWKGERLTLALAYDIGTEDAAEQAAHPRTFWTGGAVFSRWHISGPWSVAIRPEFYWDRNGRLTGSEQLITAVTTTLEYRLAWKLSSAILRMEYRHDESTGPGGGFFKGGAIAPGVPGLVAGQHLLLFSAIWSFDS